MVATKSDQTPTKKADVKKAEVKKPEVKKPEVKTPEVKKPEVKKPVVKKPEVKKPEVKKPEVKKAEVKKAEPAKTEPAKTESAKVEPVKAEPAKAAPAKAAPAKAAPAKAAPAKAAPAAKAPPAALEKQEEPASDAKAEASPKPEEFKKPLPVAESQNGPEEKSVDSIASTKEETEQGKSSEDATLILSAEEEAEIGAQTNEDAVKDSKAEPDTSPAKKPKEAQKNVWISNIARGTKAADLKKIFSEKFKVESAKIVTNGRSFFGYICLETAEMALQSVSELNEVALGERKLNVSLTRPDLKPRAGPVGRGREPRKDSRGSSKTGDGVDEEKAEGKKEDGSESGKDAKESTEEKKAEDPEEEKLRLRRKEQKANRLIEDLRTDLKRISTELQNNRRRLTEANRRLDLERDRKVSMRRDIETLEAQLKSERRKFAQELEQMEKKRKLDEIRYQEDRAVLNKELDECRKLREYLERKVEDLGFSRQTRTSPRRSGGPSSRGIIDRGSDKMQRSSRGSARSPPPAPKINNRWPSRDRSPSSYKGAKKPRLDDSQRSFGSSHYQGPGQSFSSGGKPLLAHYPQSGGASRDSLFGSTAYPDTHRYGGSSSSYNTGGYQMGNPAPLMSRPMGYPDVKVSGGPRKY